MPPTAHVSLTSQAQEAQLNITAALADRPPVIEHIELYGIELGGETDAENEHMQRLEALVDAALLAPRLRTLRVVDVENRGAVPARAEAMRTRLPGLELVSFNVAHLHA